MALAIIGAGQASAYNTAIYASRSKLATGKWVKISIPESGVYEVTYEELLEMGFSNPEKVKVFGNGGYKINEVFSMSLYDDLKRIPILRKNNKICFYGKGPVALTVSDYTTMPHYNRTYNPYSQVGCYFLTEDDNADYSPGQKAVGNATEYFDVTSSLDYFYHERELFSVLCSGKEMMGEEFTHDPIYIDYQLPGIVDSTVILKTSLATNVNCVSYVNGVLHSGGVADTTAYSPAASRIYAPATQYVSYNSLSPYGPVKLTHPAEQGRFEPLFIRDESTLAAGEKMAEVMSCLDYFIITYKHNNVMTGAKDNQLRMGYASTTGNERFILRGATSNTLIWCVNEENTPQQVVTTPYSGPNGSGLSFTALGAIMNYYVAFDPTKTLKKISSFEPVENQNLHAMPIPDLLIISSKPYLEQAERLAQMHRAVDGIDVAVVTQDQVFNEFSSGTRDAMAYRLMCKMLYDRDTNKNKFKNLLLFGTGSYDNRELMGEHPSNLLTYQSDVSNDKNNSYTCDDFFGYLDDGSGSSLPVDRLRIGVGRITCSSVEEAKSDVDKIIDYYTTPDYGSWRNNTMISTDDDNGKYMFIGEGYKNTIEEQVMMHANTVHNAMYPRSNVDASLAISRRTATEAKEQMAQFLKEGAYLATYSGHAGPTSFTKTNYMWTTADVVNYTYPHWPVMSTACCDVAHFDNDSHGIAELMFHKRNGGAIALLTSTRNVIATSNDQLNQYFMSALFNHDSTGRMVTLGEAYRDAKLGFTTYNQNKLSFFLLGDPAIKFNYPVSRFNITKVNGTSIGNTSAVASVTPLSRFEVEATVVDANGKVDQTFNGDATLILYDKQEYFTNVTRTVNGEQVSRDIFFNRPKLAEVTGRVTNGVFKGSIVAPKQVLAQGENVLLRSYAHKDNSDYMVNGSTTQVKMLPYNESTAIDDTANPVITGMYINDEYAPSTGASVGNNAMLYITATDDQGINVQNNLRQGCMSLSLDGGKTSFSDVNCFVTATDNGKMVNIEYPLENLLPGQHSITYTVYDLVGNSAKRTITFLVADDNGAISLVADKWPAYKGDEVSFDIDNSLPYNSEMTLRVTDATGKLVWMTTSGTFPVAWDMKDMNGHAVPAGLFRYFGTYNDGANYGGTAIGKLIVLDPVKTAN